MKLSAVVLTKNEERNIEACLKTLAFCDEIIVVDDYSEDSTLEIINKLNVPPGRKPSGVGDKCQIFRRRLEGDFAAQRNYGLSKAKGDWVLFVDADERVPEALADEISKVKSPSGPGQRQISNWVSGFYIKRQDYMWGRALHYGETASVNLLRLAKRSSGKWVRSVHETWEIEGRTYTLNHPILHYPHPTLREFITDINTFSTLHAQANNQEDKRANLVKIIFWPLGKFFYNFIYKLGFLDGLRGFIIATVMSFHSFLAWSKLWFSQN